MATQTKTQIPTQKPVFFKKVKVVGEIAKYKAFIGDYLVRGITAGSEAAVREVVNCMAAAPHDLIDKVRQLVASVVDNVIAVSKSGVFNVGTYAGVVFHLGEYIGVMVKLERVTHIRAASKWWGEIRVIFKGNDGHKALSKHVVVRYVEFYSDVVSYDKLYNTVYEATRIAFNAYRCTSENL
jgi:hypothetical protein